MIENYHGQHGWKEFNRNRKDILEEIDKVFEQTSNRPLQVAHGVAVEAKIRNWLSEFLPKKYGVTSGYIIPDLYDVNPTLYHYDIIIYNQFEAPILWTEGNFDQSEQGKSRAIPAKYVVCVYEVKSRLTKDNVINALAKLRETSIFNNQLNTVYSCGVIFIDLKEKDNNNESIIKELLNGNDIPGFSGGMILRYENDPTSIGIIKIFDNDSNEEKNNQICKPIAKIIDTLNIYKLEDGNIQLNEKGTGLKIVSTGKNTYSYSKRYTLSYSEKDKMILISWSRSNFSEFCVNLLSDLEGLAYNDKKRPSFGQIFDKIELKNYPLQGSIPITGNPFIKLSLLKNTKDDDDIKIIYKENLVEIKFSFDVLNQGDADAVIYDNFFKELFTLPAGKTATISSQLNYHPGEEEKDLKNIIQNKPYEFIYRIFYYPINSNKNFCSVEQKLIFKDNDIEII